MQGVFDMLTMADVTTWYKGFWGECTERAIGEGFMCGLGLGLVLPLGLLLLAWMILHRRRACRSMCIESEGGNLIIAASAIRDFLQRIVAEFRDVELLGVVLLRRKRVTDIRLRVNAVPMASVRHLKDGLKERVRTEMADKLGLEELLGDVHIDVVRYSADEKRIARKAAKCRRGDTQTRRPSTTYPPYATGMGFSGRGEDDGVV
jgi:hypothetical protein